VNPSEILAGLAQRVAAFPTHTKVLLTVATTVLVGELFLRRFFPRSRVYAVWKRVFEKVGVFWTAVILSLVYFLSVSLVSLGMRLFGKDPLDRALQGELSFWRRHEPNPLGPRASVSHQF
jgi:hypothetical protein